jgi:PPP family 3-phenylpropionic acid transporter
MLSAALPRFVLLYAAMYAAYGVASPFLPAFLGARGLTPGELGLALGAGTAVRLIAAPLAGRIADVMQALRAVLAVCAALAALASLGYLAAHGFWLVLAVVLLHAASLGPVSVLADALALGASRPGPPDEGGTRRAGSFEYGWVRGTGSAAFIAGTLLSGVAVAAWGLGAIVWQQAALLCVAALAALLVPAPVHRRIAENPPADVGNPTSQAAGSFRTLLRIPMFRNLVLAAALILGSHAMHDVFAVIRWNAAGVSAATSSLLWSEAVAAEVLVFFFIGPALVTRLTPAGAIALAASAGIVRWAVMAQTSDVRALALAQPLHGFTFALLHLACMRLLARIVPAGLEGTAQAIYATLGVGTASALLTFASGALYGNLGARGFWLMSALCALALPLAWKLRMQKAAD